MGKKKGGKKDAPKEQSSESNVTLEEPSTSAPPEVEPEDDAGLTGAARKKKEKKEKKEKALQALQTLQASRKPASEATSETASRADSEIPSEPQSRAQSEAPLESSSEGKIKSESKVPTEVLSELSLKDKSEEKTEDTEDIGLGLTGGGKKRKPRKKKADSAQQAEAQPAPTIQAAQARPIPAEQLPSTAPVPAPIPVQMPEPVQSAPPGPWGRGASQSAGRGRGLSRGAAPSATTHIPGTQFPPQGHPQYPQQGPPQFPPQGPPQYLQQGHPQYPQQGPPQFPPQGPPQFPPQGPPQYPQQGHPQYPQQGPPQFPPQGLPQHPQQGPPQFPPQGPPQFPPQGHPQYPQQGHPQYPQQGHPQYPQQGPPQFPPQGPPQYPQQTPQQVPGQERAQLPQQAPPQLPRQTTPQDPPQVAQQKTQIVRPPGPSPKSLEPVLCRYKIPTKIPGGTVRARIIQVMVNYLEMDFKNLKIARYDVSIHPDRPKKMLPQIFQQVKSKYFPNELIAFDQMKNCYSLRPLKNITATERFSTVIEIVDQNGKNMKFEVTMKATGVVDLGNIRRYMTSRGSSLCQPTEEIQCIDVILRQGALESYVKAGRQFFKRPARPVDLGYGYEMWTGLFQSAIFTSKAFINIDVAHKGFPRSQSLLDALVKDFNLDPSRPLDNQRGVDYFAAFVKGLKVVAVLVGDSPSSGHRREFVCNSLVDPPDQLTFTLTEPNGRQRQSTVADYFAKDKKYKLKYPRLNCLWVGSRDKNIYFPIEMLHVAFGQPLSRQLNEVQVSKMVREAATPPDDRMHKIKEVISNMKYSQNKDFKAFGLDISEKFYSVKAKVLQPPTLDIGSGTVQPRKGQWQANRLLKPEALQSWGLIALDTDPRNDYDPMISMIISTGTQMGMSVAKPKFVNVNAKMRALHSILSNTCQDVRLVFIIVSARSRDDYHRVKQMAEREVGILTQCIKEMTVRRMNPMTAKNILLKVNSKLMGVNQAIDTTTMPKCLREGGVMIVGADVTHPSPDQSNVPSIAAVTASMDPKCFIYNIELSIQTPKKEVIVEFEDMMFDHLKLYKERNNNSLPRKIFVFRDGVSEGQFAQVMNSELSAVHNAYQRMAGPNKKPEVLFLLVQKRHHTRLFNEGQNQQYNVEPGTVVDTDIVHASELDFYLVSHQAIKGTARPTRYHAVCNDGRIPDDEVEQLTYYLCHLYSRCMRSVSYPTPTYYAHLACFRARSLTFGEKFDNKELERKPKRLHVLDKMLKLSRMFFV